MSRSTKPSARLRARQAVAATAALVTLAALSGFGSAASASVRPAANTVHAASAARTAAKIAPADRDGDHGEVPEAGVCATCKPPLVYPAASGPVMGATGTLTITPIYWTPAGYSFDSADPVYRTLINRYITDIAAASGTKSNVYSILPEYYQTVNGVTTNIKYTVVAGTPQVDTDAFPATGQCTNVAGPAGTPQSYTACITDAQTQAELKAYTTANSLPVGLNNFYALFFPPGAQTQLGTTNYSFVQFAGYHGHAGTGSSALIYGNEPFDNGAYNVSDPNGDNGADSAISTLSHEISEAVTDPMGGSGWGDTASPGNEIGDECATQYGPALGTVNDPVYGPQPYNQVINGDKYYTQEEFSNAAYKATGVGTGCRQTAYGSGGNIVRKSGKDTAGVTSTIVVDAGTPTLPADGSSTSTVTATATDSNGDPVAGDTVVLSARDDIATPGACGTLSTGTAPGNQLTTNAAGQVTATYTASTTSADCYLEATDTTIGSTDQTLIYQGSDESTAPAVTQTAPATTLTSGGDTTTFTESANNPSPDTIQDARFDLYISGDDNGATGISASQLTLAYKDPSTGGQFVNIPLTGSTANGGVIDGFIVPDTAQSLDAAATKTADFQLTLAGNAADSATTGAPLQVETDLDQFNPADGSQTNLLKGTPNSINVVQAAGDTITYNGKLVTTLAPSGSTPGQATLVAKTCTFTSDGAGCRLTGTETFTAAGGTLTGTITTEPKPGRPDQTITYTETFTNSSPTQGSGTGTAQVIDFDNGNSFTANLADVYNTIPDPTAPNVEAYSGTLTLTNPTP
jgi:hypothetical protein